MQKLPASGPAREALRERGQFWTPAWLARVMAAWVTAHRPSVVFDPAVGPGTFFAAAREVGFSGGFAGFELDEAVLAESYKLGLPPSELSGVTLGDFIGSEPANYPAIISNPPYIRHHRLDQRRKDELRRLAVRCLGFPLDGRVGLHIYFLLKCLSQLAPRGRLAFLLPADVCEGVSASAVWTRLLQTCRLDAVLTFSDEAAPFPAVDTNAMVFLMSNALPTATVRWLRVLEQDVQAVLAAVSGKPFRSTGANGVVRFDRSVDELLLTGLSRPPRAKGTEGVPLSAFAKVVRGIATGANDFFFLTSAQLRAHDLDRRLFKRAIGRTRDCRSDTLRPTDLEALDAGGRPTWLLSLGAEPKEALPRAVQEYLQQGEKSGLAERVLIETRKPWYRMEQRASPPLLFAYLGRRDCRFILNCADVVPLTGFLCVYPWDDREAQVRRLWRALNHPATIQNLSLVGKSYGGGALKVEPRQLDTLEIPHHVLAELELSPPPVWSQATFLDAPRGKSRTRTQRGPVRKQKPVSR